MICHISVENKQTLRGSEVKSKSANCMDMSFACMDFTVIALLCREFSVIVFYYSFFLLRVVV